MKSFRLLPAALLAGFLAAAGAAHAADAATPRPPNILHLHADDLRADGLHALGTDLLRTPNLDTIVARGRTFTHAYTQGSMEGAVCQPSRAMLLTGKSWRRVPGRKDPVDPATTLPGVIAAAGYSTFHVGKSGNGFIQGLNAFQTNIIIDDRTPELRTDSSERHADAVLGFLQQRGANAQPFYIYVAPPVPHDPRVAPAEFTKLYDPAKIPLSAAFLPQHPWDNGEMAVRDELLAPWPRTPADTKQQLAEYYASISAWDHQIGRIFAALKASGEWENTIIVVSSDNGLSMGDHGLFGKQNVYEFGGMHVPLVVAGPGIASGRSEALVYLLDLFPTFADFAHATAPAGIEGHSLVPILQGKQTKVRDVLYTGYKDGQRAIRNDRWKLIRYTLVDRTQLFDLSVDPHELNNLAGKPEYADKVAALTAALQREMDTYGDATPLTVANPQPADWTPPPPKPPATAAGK